MAASLRSMLCDSMTVLSRFPFRLFSVSPFTLFVYPIPSTGLREPIVCCPTKHVYGSSKRGEHGCQFCSFHSRLPAFPPDFRRYHLHSVVPLAVGIRLSDCRSTPRRGAVALSAR